jgi:cellulose synthase/poly-beta-1,6-N-acetylglucosamine synthase-like glycosyltransferase
MWQFLFWGSLALVLYTYVGYPLILLAIGRARRRRETVDPAGAAPSVCVIVSAYNEEKVIRQKIENTLALDYPGSLSIVVASDGSNDRTVAIAREYEDHGVYVHHSPLRRGKNTVLNEVVRERREDILVFTDGNALLARDAVARLVERFRSPSIGCVVGELRYSHDVTSVAEGESLYWRYESLVKTLESRLGSVLVANGAIFSIRRGLFRDLFPDVANDFQSPFDVANQGRGTVYEPRALAVEQSTQLWGEEFVRKVRVVTRGFTGFARLRGRMHGMRLWQFVSHKLIRWCVGAALIVTLVANAMLADRGWFFAAFLALQALCYLAALGGWLMRSRRRMPRVFYVPFYFTMVNFAALIAMARVLVGRRQVVWDKAESARGATAVAPVSGFASGPLEAVASAERAARRHVIEK